MPSDHTHNTPDLNLALRIPSEGERADVRAVVYAFDRSGNLRGSAPLEDDTAKLSLGAISPHRLRLLVGPELPKERGQEPTIGLLKRLNAYEPAWTYNPRAEIQELLPIPEWQWKLWPWCRCRIRGQVVRPVSLGGGSVDLPVCHARVHICEVDRWPRFIYTLPDHAVSKLRDDLLRELVRPRPIPEPDPAPFLRDLAAVDPTPSNIARLSGTFGAPDAVRLNPQPEPPGIAAHLHGPTSKMAAVAFNPQPDPPATRELPVGMLAQLRSESTQLVRETLASNLVLIRPYLCLWPWLFWHYRCDEIAVLETDSQGHFDTTYWYPCLGDRPDLYFWVEYFIGGVWTTVYHPPIACNTYWNYACGTEITIRVTDPRVPACGAESDPAGKQVIVTAVGENVSLAEIQPSAAGSAEGLTSDGAPFAGRLELRALFGREALFAAGITHYRWSYHRLTLGDGVTPAVDPIWHHIDHPIVRHYMVIDPTPPDFPVSFPVEPMGPDPVFPGQNLFKIQPFAPSVPNDGWQEMDAHEDKATAIWLTHLLEGGDVAAAAGKYELKLELFKGDGTRVNMTSEGVLLKVPDVPAPFGDDTVTTTAPTPEHLIVESSSLVAFRMVVRIDNNVCHGTIDDVQLNGALSGPCGFLEYPEGAANTTVATVGFQATHPHNFATFDFTVARGSAGTVAPASASGAVGAPQNGFAHAGGVYTKDLTVATLLNNPPSTPPCTSGAFAASLHVYAMATDGWTRQSYLDAPRPGERGLLAFALAPTHEEE